MRALLTVTLIVALFPIWLGAALACVATSIARAGWAAGDRFLDWML